MDLDFNSIAGIVALVLVFAFEVTRRVAPLTKTDKDDAIVRKLAPFAEKIKSWADPESDEVPPTPANPGGKG